MSKELEIFYEMKHYLSLEWSDTEDLILVEKSLKALEIIKKYVYIKDLGEDNGDFFRYYIKDKQYVSSRSCNVMSKEEYDILKESLK